MCLRFVLFLCFLISKGHCLVAYEDRYFWENNEDIDVFFVNGNIKYREVVKNYASIWTKYANINLVFHLDVDYDFSKHKNQADILIKFNPINISENIDDVGGWSRIGSDSREAAKEGRPSMQFNNLIPSTIVHEFGHALGFAHEHQRADRPELNYEGKYPERYKPMYGLKALTQKIDFQSVMHYERAFKFYKSEEYKNIERKELLSRDDKLGARRLYPGRISFEEIIENDIPLEEQEDNLYRNKNFFLYITLAQGKQKKFGYCKIFEEEELFSTEIERHDCPAGSMVVGTDFGYKETYRIAGNQCYTSRMDIIVDIDFGRLPCSSLPWKVDYID